MDTETSLMVQELFEAAARSRPRTDEQSQRAAVDGKPLDVVDVK
jgi:hypothetical protein